AIVAGARARGLEITDTNEFDSVTGQGITALVQGRQILVGNTRLLDAAHVDASELDVDAARLASEGKTPMLVALDGARAGVVAAPAPPKDDSLPGGRALQDLGFEVVRTPGDTRRTATAVAKQVGIARVLAEVLPDRKALEVRRLQGEGRSVGMV